MAKAGGVPGSLQRVGRVAEIWSWENAFQKSNSTDSLEVTTGRLSRRNEHRRLQWR